MRLIERMEDTYARRGTYLTVDVEQLIRAAKRMERKLRASPPPRPKGQRKAKRARQAD